MYVNTVAASLFERNLGVEPQPVQGHFFVALQKLQHRDKRSCRGENFKNRGHIAVNTKNHGIMAGTEHLSIGELGDKWL